MDIKSPLFEALKKKANPAASVRHVPSSLYFQLNIDEYGAYLRIIDDNRKEIEPDYRAYNGPVRDVLQAIDAIKLRSAFQIDWDKPSGRLYLADHEYLLWQLRQCPNVLDAAMRTVEFMPHEQKGNMILMLRQEGPQLEATFALRYQGIVYSPVLAITETCIYTDGKIIETEPLGGRPGLLRLFQTMVFPHELEQYLSLLLSNYPNLSVEYPGYQMRHTEARHTIPCLFVEKIDADNSLYLRVSQTMPGAEPTLIEQYDLQKYVTINEMEKVLQISDIISMDITHQVEELRKKLNQYRKIVRTSADYVADGTLLIIQEELAREFIRRELPGLVHEFAVFGAENLKSYRIRPVAPTLSVALGHGLDFLEGQATLTVENEQFALFDALTFYKQNGYIQLSDGTQALPNEAYMRKLERIFQKNRRKAKLSFFDLPIVEELLEEKAAESAFPKARAIFRGFATYHKAKYRMPELQAELRPYQTLGYKWLRYLHEHKLGGCLADDMGLGKTLQTIALLSAIYPAEKMPSLIAMPKSLLFNWEQELKRFAPALKVYTYYGAQRDLETALRSQIILTTYSVLRHDIEKLRSEYFHAIILDESQNIKNLNSRTSKAAMLLNATFRLALSGTPIENNIGELYALFRFLNPAMFGSPDEFSRMYAAPIQKDNDKDAARELRKKIYPFILRRLKKDVADELPDRIEQIIHVEMSAEQSRLYEQRRQFYYTTLREEIAAGGIERSQFHILQALSDLRQIASSPEMKSEGKIISPKREVLLEQVQDAVANGHKVLIFTNYLAAVENICADLAQAGIQAVSMTGSTAERQPVIEKFQNDPAVQAFVMTLKTGGLGLNLTAADTIFLFDPWWNIAAEHQAIDRAHRIGQKNTVLSYKLISRGTIEEKIVLLQERKKELFDAIISTDNASVKSLTEEDIEFILGDKSDL
jgi:SNF2 family DNA or RNA helicase